MKYALFAVLAGLLGAVPAPAQHGGTYYQAHTFQGRYYPAGHYTQSGGCYYHNGQVCHGYASAADYHAKVVVQKVVVQEVPFYWSVNPYQQAAPAPSAESKVLDSLLLAQQQNTAFQQQQTLLLMQALLARPAVPADPHAPAPVVPQFQPIPAAKTAPAKAGVEAFVGKYCLSCHGGNGAKGGLDMSDLSRLTRDQWEGAYDRMWCDKDMPPADKPQPTDAELKAVRPEMRQRKLAAK